MYDIHTHVVPYGLRAFDDDPRWPLLRDGTDGGPGAGTSVLVTGRGSRPIDERCWNPERRLVDMDADGVRVQVLSPLPDLLAYWADAGSASAWCTAMNEWLADAVSAHPRRFRGLGIVPAQDIGRACAQLDEIAALGLAGVEVGTDLGGVRISDPAVEPLLRRAAELDLVVFVHANDPSAFAALPPAVAKAAGYPLDIGAAVTGLVAGSALARCPGLVLVASHGAGVAPLALHRLQDAWQHDARVRATLAEPPRDALRRVGCDSLSFDSGALQYGIDVLGIGRVMVGSDYPFHDEPPGAELDVLGLPPDALGQIVEGNAEAVFGYRVPSAQAAAEGAGTCQN